MARKTKKKRKASGSERPPSAKSKRRKRAATRRIERTTKTTTRFFRNNPFDMGIANDLLPAFAAYGGTRLLTRIVMVQVAKRWPGMAKHAGAIAAGASFGAAWLLGNKIQPVERWHQPITIGSAVAAIQTVVQTYLPRFAWLVSDCDLGQYQPTAGPSAQLLTPVQMAPAALPEAAAGDEDYITDEEVPEDAGAPPIDDDLDEDFAQGVFAANDD